MTSATKWLERFFYFGLSEDVDGNRGFYCRGFHFYGFGWEWDIGFWYFNRWR